MVEQTIAHEIRVQWERSKINLVELAKKRWIEGWPIEKLAQEFDYKKMTIQAALRRLKNGEINSIDLGPQQRKAIIKAIETKHKKTTNCLKAKERLQNGATKGKTRCER